jgi:uncharacterized protein (DUF1330 family)
MPKGYVIARADVVDPEAYARYAAAASEAIAACGGEAPMRNVALEFARDKQARRYYYSERRQAARKLREGAAEIELAPAEEV